MSWQLVARKDFEDAIRSWMLWAIIGVFVTLMVIVTAGANANTEGAPEFAEFVNFFTTLGGELLIPLTALMVGYLAITGERQSGSLRLLFGLTHDRRGVMIGKLTSRAGVMVIAALVTCVTAGVMGIVLGSPVPLDTFLVFTGFTVLLALSFIGIAIGVSARSATRMRSMGGVIGSYVLFVVLWQPIVAGIHYLSYGELAGLEPPEWYLFAKLLNPIEAYRQAMMLLIDETVFGLFGWEFMVENLGEGAQQGSTELMLTNRVAGDLPIYLSEWAIVVVLLVWFIVPVALGYRAFEDADLN